MIELGALLLLGVAVVCLVLTAGLILKTVLWVVLLPVPCGVLAVGTLLLLPLLLIKLLVGGIIFLIALPILAIVLAVVAVAVTAVALIPAIPLIFLIALYLVSRAARTAASPDLSVDQSEPAAEVAVEVDPSPPRPPAAPLVPVGRPLVRRRRPQQRRFIHLAGRQLQTHRQVRR